MFFLEILSAGKKVFLKTESEAINRYFLDSGNVYPHTQIPELEVKKLSRVPSLNGAFLLNHKESRNFSITLEPRKRQLTIGGRVEDISTSQFVWFLLPIFEFLYEERKMFSVHSACVAKKDRAILILGDTLDGKSTVSALLFNQFGFDFVCDEKCVVDPLSNKVLSGNRILGLRYDPFSQKIALGTKRYKVQHASWKNFFELPKAKGDIKVVSIVIPHFRDLDFKIEKMSIFDSVIYLYDNITRTIRSTNVVPVKGGVAFPSLDNKNLANQRIKLVKDFISKHKLPISFYMGRKDNVCREIAKLFL